DPAVAVQVEPRARAGAPAVRALGSVRGALRPVAPGTILVASRPLGTVLAQRAAQCAALGGVDPAVAVRVDEGADRGDVRPWGGVLGGSRGEEEGAGGQ